ncbi:hypothetical protein L1887_54503 [Cichorium endivia]|nr:hypothetical protein L1887_54503 [Cichorium endivia]
MADWHTSNHTSEVRRMDSILSARPCEEKGRRTRVEALRPVYFAAAGRGAGKRSDRRGAWRLGWAGTMRSAEALAVPWFLGPAALCPYRAYAEGGLPMRTITGITSTLLGWGGRVGAECAVECSVRVMRASAVVRCDTGKRGRAAAKPGWCACLCCAGKEKANFEGTLLASVALAWPRVLGPGFGRRSAQHTRVQAELMLAVHYSAPTRDSCLCLALHRLVASVASPLSSFTPSCFGRRRRLGCEVAEQRRVRLGLGPGLSVCASQPVAALPAATEELRVAEARRGGRG